MIHRIIKRLSDNVARSKVKRPGLLFLMLFNIAAVSAESRAQGPTLELNSRRQFNQVFVKVIVPVTPRTPKQNGPIVESWIAEQLKELGEPDYFAVTDWVPVCDALLEDDVVDNRVWDGTLGGKHSYCPVGGDIPKRENGRVLVNVGGWTPSGGEANIALSDEPAVEQLASCGWVWGGKENGLRSKRGSRM